MIAPWAREVRALAAAVEKAHPAVPVKVVPAGAVTSVLIAAPPLANGAPEKEQVRS